MDLKMEQDLNRIQESLKEILGVDEIPAFEVNDQTIPVLLQIISNHDAKRKQNSIIAHQMRQETEELKADRARMNKVLTALDIDPARGISPKTKKLVKTLSQAMDALSVASFSLPMMAVAITEMQDKLNKSSNDIEMFEERCKLLREDCNEAKELFSSLHRQFSELELQLPSEQKRVENLQRSSQFHQTKKKQYDVTTSECESRLREVNFHPQLSHEEIGKFGRRASELQDKLKPLLLQLDSYNQLPADANLARLKLCEVMNELKEVDAELHEVLQHVSLSK